MREYAQDAHTPGRVSLRGTAEALVLYAGIPAATMYPLGLLTLWVQISATYDEGLSSAWFAVNQVPSSVLVGLGAGALWQLVREAGFTFHVALISLFALAILLIVAARKREAREAPERAEERLTGNIQAAEYHVRIPIFDLVLLLTRRRLIVVAAFALIVSLPRAVRLTSSVLQGDWATALSGLMLGASFLLGVLTLTKDGLDAQYKSVGTPAARWMLRGLAIAFLGIVAAAIIRAGIQDPPLPHVELSEPSGGSVEVILLTHSDGYWYVFNSEGKLTAVSDDEAKAVSFSE